MAPVYIVIALRGIGGTEKRFSELWQYFMDHGHREIHLVLQQELFEKLISIPYLTALRIHPERVHILNNGSHSAFLWQVIRLALRAPKGSRFHYFITGIPLLHRLLRQKMIISNTAGIFIKDVFPSRLTRLYYWACLMTADKVDFVDPTEFASHKKISFMRRKSHLTTPGTFTRMDEFFPSPKKENWIVFLGRFDLRDKKNVIPFVRAIPEIHQSLKNHGIQDPHFFILGHGDLEDQIRVRLSRSEYSGINITFKFDSFPGRILQKSKVFMSIQKDTNYPSKALVEALAAGNLPVVTDIADSRLLAKEDFSFFVSKVFTGTDLANQILRILRLSPEEFKRKSDQAVAHIRENFSIDASGRYFLDLYELAPRIDLRAPPSSSVLSR